MSRKIAIQFSKKNAKENVISLVNCFSNFGLAKDVVVFAKQELIDEVGGKLLCAFQVVPEEIDNEAKFKNFILNWAQDMQFDGFLHTLEDIVIMLKDPTEYINSVENAMRALDYGIYFSTISDPCNYVFKKFCPRLSIDIDDEAINAQLKLPSRLAFTSHSNTVWTIHDFSNPKNIMKYDDRFSIAMFYIIEYLARRKAIGNGALYFMNQYLSVSDEVGTYSVLKLQDDQLDPKKMQEEDALFKSMEIDYAPDNNVDIILEKLYQVLHSKISHA